MINNILNNPNYTAEQKVQVMQIMTEFTDLHKKLDQNKATAGLLEIKNTYSTSQLQTSSNSSFFILHSSLFILHFSIDCPIKQGDQKYTYNSPDGHCADHRYGKGFL